ncbi:MAG TPA: hypothetical protein VLG09_03520 [Candidatus Saccharimonadales bacterium]|nr:hypothetical protein [Candidatus Saccharimonadales bacterium]
MPPWWSEPSDVRDIAIESRRGELIRQAPETCWATSCLNAWVARGSLTGPEAQAIQDKLLSDPNYRQFFDPGTNHWILPNPEALAYAASEVTGRRMSFAKLEGGEANQKSVQAHLLAGLIAVIGTSEHFRTVLRPSEYPEMLAVIDPKRPQELQFYPLDEARVALDELYGHGIEVVLV